MRMRGRRMGSAEVDPVAGNGLLDRRILLRSGIALAGSLSGASLTQAEPLPDDPWSLIQGTTTAPLEPRSRFEKNVKRTLTNPNGEPRTQHARAPLHLLQGTVTPNDLHFTIVHNGSPDIDPAKHRLVIHGMVKQPLVFTLDKLARYPMMTRM